MNPAHVNWQAALAALGSAAPGTGTPRELVAEVLALAARGSGDYADAAGWLAGAVKLEPLNPLHRMRVVLHHLRFGAHAEALSVLERLPASVRELPLPGYLKALAELRGGEARRAANIAGSVLSLHAGHSLARFLEAEAQLISQPKRIEKAFSSLPREPSLASLWADLLVKALVSRPAELLRSVEQQLEVRKVLPKGSPEEALVRRALAWSSAPLESFEAELEALPPGSRAEELALLVFNQRAATVDKDGSRLKLLRGLHAHAPERKAVRRLYVAALTGRAVEEAAAERYPAALRLVEACLRMEPHEPLHRQNRAALFTLMGDAEAYHDAWEDLERHHYRLALLGQLTPASALAMARPHRMFARQARLTPEAAGGAPLRLGVFRPSDAKAGEEPGLEVNQQRLDTDPEQLRQWLHHRRAELTFEHLALGPEPERFLLGPEDPRMALARLEGLALGAESLAVLVDGEGRLLADMLTGSWRELAKDLRTRYTREGAGPEVQALRARHLESFADLALLCRAWEPDAARPDLVEELLEFLRAEAPFFDEATFAPVLADHESPPSWTVKVLQAYVRHTFAQPERELRLSEAQRRELSEGLAAEVLLNLAVKRFEAAATQEQLEQVLEGVDRARKANPQSLRVEFWAARIALRGDYLEEAKAALSRFHALSHGTENPYQRHVEELQNHLAERQKAAGKGARRAGGQGTRAGAPAERRAEELEAEIERLPTSVQLYEELAHALAASGHFDAALEWSERAIARCLSRQGQLRARALNLELLGLRALWGPAPTAVQLYLSGSRGGALDAMKGVPGQDAPYPLDYVRGMCLLAARQPEAAQASFGQALARCERHLHLAVLRPLAQCVEEALLEQLRRAVEDALQGGAHADALREVAQTLPELKQPEACLLELVRIQLSEAASTLGSEGATAPLPALGVVAPWAARLRDAAALPTPLARARRLAELAAELHAPSGRDAQVMLRKLELLEQKAKSAAALAESGRLLRQGKLEAALAALDAAGEGAEGEAAILWQRALLSLRLERFAEADHAVARLEHSREGAAREWLLRYPELAFRQRLSVINRLLRQDDRDAAAELIASTRAPGREQELELAYCRAFCLALKAYKHRSEGERKEAVAALTEALDVVEPLLTAARAAGMTRLAELQSRLDQDLAALQEEAR
ncbi:hypothetical protein [Pyxidicoccus caerfyrddinensis]|uniref:hypothetical protein n=1 Tax=Pyxidicoccus caerfyrddinensis TaxID=2709663 RepID=UPI0013DA9F70|nr:hypothetical protein [Pyxidicoccus caerfyrddinensis]